MYIGFESIYSSISAANQQRKIHFWYTFVFIVTDFFVFSHSCHHRRKMSSYEYLERNDSFLELLQSFAIHTSVPLVIEWLFNSVSLVIETRFQNMAVMAVWRKEWKRHVLVAIVNVLPAAIWSSGSLLVCFPWAV